MTNMSYCRFENTLGDLRDCHQSMHDPVDQMSSHEQAARLQLFELVIRMAGDIRNSGVLEEEDTDLIGGNTASDSDWKLR